MTEPSLPVEALHEAFEDIPNEVAHHGTTEPRPHEVYVVPGHEKALNPDVPVVVGDRGTGKSFWSAALNGDATRTLIADQLRRLRLHNVDVSWGYSSESGSQSHPSRRGLRKLRQKDGYDAEDIWRAVILHQLLPASNDGFFAGAENWTERVRRITDDPDGEERLLADIDQDLQRRDKRHLIVFDALDRLGDDWAAIRDLLQGLLRVSLDLRSRRAIRIKLFLRPDMWEDRSIWAFPDASKLHHGRVMLEWRRVDLYGLLWHVLGNHREKGAAFRDWCSRMHTHGFTETEAGGEAVHLVPSALRTDEAAQSHLLKDIASQFMGRDRRRGKTYTWLPTHLADAKGQVSPRSFLLALKTAHAVTRERAAKEGKLLHFDGIKQGVQEASLIRRQELEEDYPWIRTVLEPLHGMTVPCTAGELRKRWRKGKVIETIRAEAERARAEDNDASKGPYLPPHALEQVGSPADSEEDALIEALIEVGVMSRTADGRLNMPDLFRVAAGIGRRGGVRAIR